MPDVQVIDGAGLQYVQAPGRLRADPLAGLRAAESVRIVRLPAGGGKRFAHRHPASAEVMYVIAGRGTVVAGDRRIAAGAGDTIYVPTDVVHGLIPDGEDMLLACFFAHPDLDANTVEMGEIT